MENQNLEHVVSEKELNEKVIMTEEIKMENNKEVKTETKANLTTERRINKWIYILLALCLGGLGLHNFYAGNTLFGIIWLVIFGIGFLFSFIGIGWLLIGMLWIVAIVQAIIALCKSSDADGCIAA